MVPHKSNCLLYAVGRWRREGGYLIIRRSRLTPWVHVLWSLDLRTFAAFVPQRARRRWWPQLWFPGRIKQWSGSEE